MACRSTCTLTLNNFPQSYAADTVVTSTLASAVKRLFAGDQSCFVLNSIDEYGYITWCEFVPAGQA